MLRECKVHGYFRGDRCPICQEEGKFLMSDEEIESIGRMMAGVLRHFPEKFGLEIDEHGWVDLRSFVNAVRSRRNKMHWLRSHHIRALIITDPKGRYQCDGHRIRATYGHSIDVDLDLPTNNIPDELYYPTSQEEAEIILETGLKPSDRKHVHLSLTPDDARRAGEHRVKNPIILRVDAKSAIEGGIVIKKAGTTVFITNEIPSRYISRLN